MGRSFRQRKEEGWFHSVSRSQSLGRPQSNRCPDPLALSLASQTGTLMSLSNRRSGLA